MVKSDNSAILNLNHKGDLYRKELVPHWFLTNSSCSVTYSVALLQAVIFGAATPLHFLVVDRACLSGGLP